MLAALKRPTVPALKGYRKARGLSTMMTSVLIVLGVPLGLYSYKCLMLIAFQNKLIYMGYLPPGSRHSEDSKQRIPASLDVREKTVVTCDKKRLHGFIVRQKSSHCLPAKSTDPIMIYFQGNAGNMSDRFDLFKTILGAIPNMTIIGIAYRQYGNSEGVATESGLKRDARAILDTVQNMFEHNRPIYLYGHSLGGAVAIDVASASNKDIHGIILENTFTSIEGMVSALYPAYSPYPYIAKYCLWNHWRSDHKIQTLPPSIRLLFLSSERDEIVPSSHMKQLYKLVQPTHSNNTTFIPFERSLHMDIYSTERHLFQSALRNFISNE